MIPAVEVEDEPRQVLQRRLITFNRQGAAYPKLASRFDVGELTFDLLELAVRRRAVQAEHHLIPRVTHRMIVAVEVSHFLDGVVKGQNGSTVEVELTGTGIVHVESSRSFTSGQQVSVAVRPEKLRLNSEVKDGNNIKGHVEDVIYIGTDTHYGVRFPGGQKARVREQNLTQAQKEIAKIGEEVTVSFTHTSPRLLTE